MSLTENQLFGSSTRSDLQAIRTYFFSNYLTMLSKTVELGSLVLNVNVLELDKGGVRDISKCPSEQNSTF